MTPSDLAASHRRAIRAFFTGLQKKGIPSFIARGGNLLPQRLEGKDLDIFVRNSDLMLATEILKAVTTEQGLEQIHFHQRSYFSAFWFADPLQISPQFLHIDLYPGVFTWKGLYYLSDDEVLDHVEERDGYPFPSPGLEVLGLLLTSPLWGGFFKGRYLPRIRELLSHAEAQEYVEKVLREKLRTDATFLQVLKEKEPNTEQAANFSADLRNGLVRNSFCRRPFRSSVQVLSFLLGEIKAWARPPGLTMAILGPDGSGKSLLLENLTKSIGPLFGSVQDFHWRPGILPDIGVLLRQRKPASGEPVSNPHNQMPHGAFSSSLRLLYYLVDYWIGWILKIWPGKARNRLVIFDRYAYDMAVDPRRYRIGLPQSVLEFFCQLAPEPDLTIILTGPAEVLFSRKQEVPLEELEIVLARLRTFARLSSQKAHEVDCKASSAEVCKTVGKQIVLALSSRRKPLRQNS